MQSAPRPASTEEWTVVLHGLVRGHWEGLVEILGTVDSIVRVILRDAADPDSCKLCFEIALSAFVSMWQPSEAMPARQTFAILDLIGAFTPSVGLGKIQGQFERVGEWRVYEGENEEMPRPSPSTSEKALHALAMYFPAGSAGNSTSGTYEAYTALLRNRLFTNDGPHCLRRLLEIHAFDVSDVGDAKDFLEVITMAGRQVITELLVLVIGTAYLKKAELMSHLLWRLHQLNRLETFAAEAAAFHSYLTPDEGKLYLETPFGAYHVDIIDSSILDILMPQYEERTRKGMSRELKELVS